uniref:Uncharacterized protein n=1 Tax=viral metagenome TaxID=1070528 RepID=A0A6C0C9C5_9ZZZZ
MKNFCGLKTRGKIFKTHFEDIQFDARTDFGSKIYLTWNTTYSYRNESEYFIRNYTIFSDEFVMFGKNRINVSNYSESWVF